VNDKEAPPDTQKSDKDSQLTAGLPSERYSELSPEELEKAKKRVHENYNSAVEKYVNGAATTTGAGIVGGAAPVAYQPTGQCVY
jgi:hypothetical protein